jgi:hypothetical protein
LSAPQRFELSGRPILPAPCLRTVRSWPANPVGMNRDSQSCVPTFMHPLSLTPSLDATWSQWAHTSVSRCAFNRCGVMARFAPRASHWLILFIYRNRFSAHLSVRVWVLHIFYIMSGHAWYFARASGTLHYSDARGSFVPPSL